MPSPSFCSDLIAFRELKKSVPCAQSTLYLWARTGHFPKPLQVGQRILRWKRSEVDAWLTEHGLEPLPKPDDRGQA